MARRKVASAVPGPIDPQDLPITDDEILYAEYLEEVGQAGQVGVNIYRVPKTGGAIEWCEDTGLEGATMAAIREKHGPGKYRLFFRGGSGRLGSKVVLIAAPYQPAGSVERNTPNPELAFLREQAAQNQQLILTLIGSNRGPDMASLITALRPPPPPDPTTMLATLVTVFTQLKGSAIAVEKSGDVKTALEIIALAKDLGGNHPEPVEENMFSVVKHVGEKVVEAFAGARQPQERPADANGAARIEAAPAVPASNPAADTQEERMQKWIRAQLAFLKMKAKANKDPVFWSDYIFENEEEPGCQALIRALQMGATLEHLLQFDPEIAQSPDLITWFRTFYDGMRETLDSPGAGGDTANVGSDADTGDRGQPDARSTKPGA